MSFHQETQRLSIETYEGREREREREKEMQRRASTKRAYVRQQRPAVEQEDESYEEQPERRGNTPAYVEEAPAKRRKSNNKRQDDSSGSSTKASKPKSTGSLKSLFPMVELPLPDDDDIGAAVSPPTKKAKSDKNKKKQQRKKRPSGELTSDGEEDKENTANATSEAKGGSQVKKRKLYSANKDASSLATLSTLPASGTLDNALATSAGTTLNGSHSCRLGTGDGCSLQLKEVLFQKLAPAAPPGPEGPGPETQGSLWHERSENEIVQC